ncbi:MAG: glycosyltransferase [Oscillospiraceae bacterium]|nr:glycosyltransferase [Oscillospiraceae bacterium]
MITIFTPTYNRESTLLRLYKSLIAQTMHEFEWIIIDDGSEDNTENIVAEFSANDNPFEITYKKKANGGKHRAINDGVKLAKYNWFFCVDSDDYIIENAIELVLEWINSIKDDNSFAGVAGLRGYISKDEKIGEYPSNKKYSKCIDATNLQRRKYQLLGDKAEIYRTEIMIKYPFPEFEGENFLSEAVVWDSIAKAGYKLRWYNNIIYKCEYLPDGLTNSGINNVVKNFQGFSLYSMSKIATSGWLMKQSEIEIYLRVAKAKGLSPKVAAENIGLSYRKTYIPRLIGVGKRLVKKMK